MSETLQNQIPEFENTDINSGEAEMQKDYEQAQAVVGRLAARQGLEMPQPVMFDKHGNRLTPRDREELRVNGNQDDRTR